MEEARGGLLRVKAGRKTDTPTENEVRLHPDVVSGEEALKQFDLRENDIFQTPQIAHQIMTEACGWDTAKAFDPCSLPQQIARNADGSLVDGRNIEWESPFYCNPLWGGLSIGVFTDGFVEVSGNISEGMIVVVPR